ncbi:MAG: 30S ribosomal protein S1 [Verrucomicrobia bacterium]|nr:30S ribosomal protein S1 [Verrucomicrobiota bacterium]
MQAQMKEWLSKSTKKFVENSLVQGKIIEARPREVVVDIGYKSEGIISLDEFVDPSTAAVGAEIEVLLERLEDDNGMVVLSYSKAELKKNWEKIVVACNEGATIQGKVTKKVKGGLMVDIGIEAFLPGSQIDLSPPKDLDQFVGNTYDFKVLKINQDRKNIVLSRRELIEQERDEKKQKLMNSLQPGDVRTGTVKNLTDFGAFIDLDGLDGLLHITDMSWGRLNHPSEMLKIGQPIEVQILEIDREKERVSLGLKQRTANPWDKIQDKFPVGAKVKGKVVNLLPYGAFVELEPGIEGLVHVSELSWTKKIARPSDVLAIGQEIEAVILSVQKEEQKISLGVRQLEKNPWDGVPERYKQGDRVKGKVRNLTTYGAFVELEDGIDGMVHVNDMSWTRKINHPSEILKKGDDIEAVILEIDIVQQRISLGIKQAQDDPWAKIEEIFKIGDLVQGKVTKIASFGAFVQLKNNIDGLVHISQISEQHVEKIKNVIKVGDDVSARVIKVDRENRRVGLSIKAANYSIEQIQKESEAMDTLKPGEDLGAMEHAFERAKK